MRYKIAMRLKARECKGGIKNWQPQPGNIHLETGFSKVPTTTQWFSSPVSSDSLQKNGSFQCRGRRFSECCGSMFSEFGFPETVAR